jgi:hypothetical protein
MMFTVPTALVVLWLPLPPPVQTGPIGHWRAVFVGPTADRPKMVDAITFTLESTPAGLTGVGRASNWPGDLTLSDIAIEGDHVSFRGTGKLGWSVSFGGPMVEHCCPQLSFEGTLKGDEIALTMRWRSTENPDDPDPRPLPMVATRVVVPQEAW